MRSLYWKIFAVFVLVTMIAVGVTLWFAIAIRGLSNDAPNITAPAAGYISAAEIMLNRGGEPLLLEWLLDLEKQTRVHVYVFDERGLSLLPKEIPPEVATYAFESSLYSYQVDPLIRSEILVKAPVMGPGGHIYLLVLEFLHPLSLDELPRYISLGTGVALVLFMLLGLLSTLYLTRPLRKLQKAARGIAEGKWHTRVSASVGNRKDAFGELAGEFDLMAEKVELLIDGQKRLVSDVSHELRSPLARLQIALELARMTTGDASEEYLDRIEKEACELNELISEILTLGRLEADQAEAAKTTVHILPLLESVVENANFEHSVADKQVVLRQSMPVEVFGHEKLLMMAFENVIRNALKYTPDYNKVEVSLGKTSRELVVWVRDHGPGVPDDMLEKLLQPFVRVHEARDRSSGGWGVGLSICDRILRFHSGTIRLSNHPGGGLEVCMRLPLFV